MGNYRNIFLLLTAILSLLTISCEYSAEPTITMKEVEKAYRTFEKAVKEKDTAALRSIFLNDDVPLNTVIIRPDTLINISQMAGQWFNMIGSSQLPYELRIGEIEMGIMGNLAYSIAPFEEYLDGNHISTGKDAFSYVQTNEGLKLSGLTVSAVLKRDTAVSMVSGLLENLMIQATSTAFDLLIAGDFGNLKEYFFDEKTKIFLSIGSEKAGIELNQENIGNIRNELNSLSIGKMKSRLINKHSALVEVELNHKSKETPYHMLLSFTNTKSFRPSIVSMTLSMQ